MKNEEKHDKTNRLEEKEKNNYVQSFMRKFSQFLSHLFACDFVDLLITRKVHEYSSLNRVHVASIPNFWIHSFLYQPTLQCE